MTTASATTIHPSTAILVVIPDVFTPHLTRPRRSRPIYVPVCSSTTCTTCTSRFPGSWSRCTRPCRPRPIYVPVCPSTTCTTCTSRRNGSCSRCTRPCRPRPISTSPSARQRHVQHVQAVPPAHLRVVHAHTALYPSTSLSTTYTTCTIRVSMAYARVVNAHAASTSPYAWQRHGHPAGPGLYACR
jgi:hypothetical protein